MATKSLGTLTIDLIAKTGGFVSGLNQAEREAKKRSDSIGKTMKAGANVAAAAFAAMSAAAVGAFAVINSQINRIADFKGLSEQIGDTAEALMSLKNASDISGVSMEAISAASIKLTTALSKTDDESKGAGAALAAIGLSLEEMKDLSPVEQIDAIAKAFDGFADGADKTAVAVALFGESGAGLIPFFNDLAGAYGRQTILTQEQIDAADAYTKRLGGVKAALNDMSIVLAGNSVPAMTALSEAVQEIIYGFDEAGKEIDGFSSSPVILEWAEGAALAIGYVYEALFAIGKILLSISGSFKAVLTDAKFVFDTAIGKGDWDKRLAERNKVVEAANKGYVDLWNYNGTAVTDAIRKSFAKQKALLANPPTQSDARPKIGFNAAPGGGSGGGSGGAKIALDNELAVWQRYNEEQSALLAQRNRILNLFNSQGLLSINEYYEVQKNILDDSTAAQVRAYDEQIAALRKYQLAQSEADKREETQVKINDLLAKRAALQRDAAASALELDIQQTAAQDNLVKTYQDSEAAAQRYLDTIKEANRLSLEGIGIGNEERNRLSGRQGVAGRYDDQLSELNSQRNNALLSGPLNADAEAQYQSELERITRFKELALNEYDSYYAALKSKQEDWSVGASEAWENYAAEASNISKQVEGIFTNAFGAMEDAIVEFAKTGKLDFAAFAQSIISDILKMIAKQIVLNSVMSMFGGSSGAGSGLMSIFGGARATGGPVDAGKTYLVGERGPELLHMGAASGTVIPNNAIGGSTVNNVSVSVNMEGGSTQSDSSQGLELGRRIEQAIRGVIVQERRPGGLLAA